MSLAGHDWVLSYYVDIKSLSSSHTPQEGDSLSNCCDGVRRGLSRISSGRVTAAFFNLFLLSLAASPIGRLLSLPNLLRLLPRFILHFTGITLCWHYIGTVIFCRRLIWTKDKFLATARNRDLFLKEKEDYFFTQSIFVL